MVAENKPLNGKTILAIEDDAALAKLLEIVFTREGYRVLIGHNGKEGLDLALSEHPDLIYLDIIMPVMGGTEMLKLLRKDEWGKTARVIIWSNSNLPAVIEEIKEYKVMDFVVKSDVNFKQLAARAKDVLGE